MAYKFLDYQRRSEGFGTQGIDFRFASHPQKYFFVIHKNLQKLFTKYDF